MTSSNPSVHLLESSTTRDEDRRRVRVEITRLLFAIDELTARNHWLLLERTRLKEKGDLIRATTSAMLAEGQCNSAAEARLTLRVYADIIREIISRQ